MSGEARGKLGPDPYFRLAQLAIEAGVSVRWLRARLSDPERPLPCYRIGGVVLVRLSEFHAWMQGYRCIGDAAVGVLVDEVLRDLQRSATS